MTCSYCSTPLPEGDDTMPNLHLDNTQGETILRLHAECVQEVINGLEYGKKLLVH